MPRKRVALQSYLRLQTVGSAVGAVPRPVCRVEQPPKTPHDRGRRAVKRSPPKSLTGSVPVGTSATEHHARPCTHRVRAVGGDAAHSHDTG